MASQVAGIVSLSIDGVYVDVASDLEYEVSSVNREGLVGQSGPQGYKTTPVWGKVSATLRDTGAGGGISMSDIINMTNVTVNAVLANGRNVIATAAFQSEVPSMNTGESTFPVTFHSASVVEV